MKHVHQAARTVEICECGARRPSGGKWSKQRKPDFSELARWVSRKYLQKATREQLAERSIKASRTRWKDKTSERDAYMRAIAQQPRPSTRIPDRCPCGKYSKYTAQKRNHKCTPDDKKAA
jgi:hypothetical protein